MEYNPDKVRRYMANANISTEITSWLKAGTRISFTNRDYRSPNLNRNPYQYAWRWPAFFENYGYINDENGTPIYTRSAIGYQINSPIDKTVTTQTRLQAWASADITKDLNLYADFTYMLYNTNSRSSAAPYYMWNTWTTKAPAKWSPYSQETSYAAHSNSKDDTWTMNVYATYGHTWNDAHSLKVMAGATAEREEYDYFYANVQVLQIMTSLTSILPMVTPTLQAALIQLVQLQVSSVVSTTTTRVSTCWRLMAVTMALLASLLMTSGRSSHLFLQVIVSLRKLTSRS